MDQAKVSIQFLTMAGSINQATRVGGLGRKVGRMHCFFGLVDFLHIGPLLVRDVELVWVGSSLPEELVHKRLQCYSLEVCGAEKETNQTIPASFDRQALYPLDPKAWRPRMFKRIRYKRQERKAISLRRPTTPCGEVA